MSVELDGILIFICIVIFLILLTLFYVIFNKNFKVFLIYIVFPLTLALFIVCIALLLQLIIKLDQKLDDNIATMESKVTNVQDRSIIAEGNAVAATFQAAQAVEQAQIAAELSSQNNAALNVVKDNLAVIQGNTHNLATNIDYVHQNLSTAINETFVLLDPSEQEIVYNPPPLMVEKINLTNF